MRGLPAILFLIFHSILLQAQLPCPSVPQAYPDYNPSGLTRSGPVLIPVVFHIVHRNDEQDVSDELLANQLIKLNNAFSEELQDVSVLLPRARPNVGSVGIKFILATEDMDGYGNESIIRIRTSAPDIGDQFTLDGTLKIKSASQGGADAWDPERYVNIWIGERNTSLGYTISATSLSDDTEGIVLDYREVLSETKTLIHEMGHYLGLLHPWGNSTGCDEEDDGIKDTPFQVAANFSCELPVDCSQRLEPGNYMDFASDDCLLFFTKLQASAMQSHLATFKQALINSDACYAPNLPGTMEYKYELSDTSLEIYLGDYEAHVIVSIYSFGGSLVRSAQLKGENFLNIDLDGIPSGLYLLVISSGEYQSNEKILIL